LKQSMKALAEADAAVFVVDGRAGISADDERIAMELRRSGKPVWLAVNKTEGMPGEIVGAEFHALGLAEPRAISAAHGQGVAALMDDLLTRFPDAGEVVEEKDA